MQTRRKKENRQERVSAPFYIGQVLKITETDKNGDKKRKTIQIKKLYRRFVLCRVNSTYNECFSYDQLATMSDQNG